MTQASIHVRPMLPLCYLGVVQASVDVCCNVYNAVATALQADNIKMPTISATLTVLLLEMVGAP